MHSRGLTPFFGSTRWSGGPAPHYRIHQLLGVLVHLGHQAFDLLRLELRAELSRAQRLRRESFARGRGFLGLWLRHRGPRRHWWLLRFLFRVIRSRGTGGARGLACAQDRLDQRISLFFDRG